MNNFCVALFNAIRKNNDVRIRPCCVFKPKEISYDIPDYINSDYMSGVRDRMINNEQVPECRVCWDKEQHGIESLRHIYNQQFLNDKIIPDRLVKKAGVMNKIVHADIKIGNTCNFACAMCHPGDSSLIYNKFKKNPDNEFVKEYTQTFSKFMTPGNNAKFRSHSLLVLEDVLKNDSIRSIKLLGGEPLLEDKFLQQLIDIPAEKKKKMVLFLVTNGSVDLVETLTKLGEFKNIFLTVSLEGTGKIQEYVRKHSNWQQIESNICKFLEFNNPRWVLGVHHTMQALSLHGLSDLTTWCDNLKIRMTIQALTEPAYLGLNILNYDYRSRVTSNLSVDTSTNFSNIDTDASLIGDIHGYSLSREYTPDLVPKFLKYIEFYEADHNLKLSSIAPELFNSLN